MTYTATLSSTLAKLSTLKEKSKYTIYIMDLYCTEEETIHNALSGLFKTKVLFQKKYNILWVVNISAKNNRIVTDNIIPVFVSKVKYGYRMTPIYYPFLKDMYRVKDANYMAYVIGKHGIADFTLTDENDFPVFEENDNLDDAIIFTQYEDAIKYRSLFIEYTKEKKKETDERHANGIFTIDEIAKKLGISPTDLKIINAEDDDYMYYEGTRPEDFGEFGDGYSTRYWD